jgi:hypothetical protein
MKGLLLGFFVFAALQQNSAQRENVKKRHRWVAFSQFSRTSPERHAEKSGIRCTKGRFFDRQISSPAPFCSRGIDFPPPRCTIYDMTGL